MRLRAIVFLLFVATACNTPDDRSESSRALVLRDASIIDGSGEPPRPAQTLVLRGDRIVALGPNDEVVIPAGAEILELTGRTVVPGFIDLHVHFPADRGVQKEMLAMLLEYGVTTMLNPGARAGAGVELRKRIESGEVLGPRLMTAGRIIDGEPPNPGLAHWCARVATEEEVRAEVRAQALAGADWVKFYEMLSPELVAAGIDEAKKLGLSTVVHAGEISWGEAARAGANMLVHSGYGTPMEEIIDLADPASATDDVWYRAHANAPEGAPFAALVEALLAGDVTVVPTLSITQAGAVGFNTDLLPLFRTELAPDRDIDDWWTKGWRERHPQAGDVGPAEQLLLAEVLVPGVLGIARAYQKRGVRLGVGTDVGNSWMTPGHVYHYELELYQRAGIPPIEILKAATQNGAIALGLEDELGTIAVGKRADLVVLSSDPAQDIRATRDIEAVFLGGRRISGREPR